MGSGDREVQVLLEGWVAADRYAKDDVDVWRCHRCDAWVFVIHVTDDAGTRTFPGACPRGCRNE